MSITNVTGLSYPYTNLITSEHSNKPNFTSMVSATCQPFADMIALYQVMNGLYDVDVAVGSQLDVVGQWVGVSRQLEEPITGVYFAFDTPGLGFDQGVWQGPTDPTSGLVNLPDDHYRLVVYAKILNNQWDGSLPQAYEIAEILFTPLGFTVFIQDPANLTMQMGLIGQTTPDALMLALFTQGDLNLRPAGVLITDYFYQLVPGPLFAFDLNTPNFAGFDSGSWAGLIA